MDVPVTCRLNEATARSQVVKWREALDVSIRAAERISPAELALRLRDDLAGVGDLLRLAQRERECCPFFGFTLQVEPHVITLTVSVPDDAIPILDEFAQLAS